uniref:Uncharacterized protein n=1 Tax=Heterorhabditis bacteriophora TaxID=37862 RepID=A0A1I7WG57_HETBA
MNIKFHDYTYDFIVKVNIFDMYQVLSCDVHLLSNAKLELGKERFPYIQRALFGKINASVRYLLCFVRKIIMTRDDKSYNWLDYYYIIKITILSMYSHLLNEN